MVISIENKNSSVKANQFREIIGEFFEKNNYSGKRIIIIVPDNTRSGPVGRIFQTIYECLKPKAKSIDCLIALGTHPPLTEEQICRRLAITWEERKSKYAS
ncbi:MAG: lactate racemase domain-containing protein, partial [Planctomycetota bacterium]